MSLSAKRDFSAIVLYGFISSIAASMGGSVLLVYFSKQNYTTLNLLFYSLMWICTPLLFLPFVSRYKTRTFMIIAQILNICYYTLASHFFFKQQLYLLGIITGVILFTNAIAFNMRFFKISTEKNRATTSALYFAIGPLTGLFIPPVAGYIASIFGMSYVFIAAILLTAVSMLVLFRLPEVAVPIKIKESLEQIKRIRPIIFLDGFWDVTQFVLLGLFTLSFIKNEIPFAFFVTYLVFFSIAGSFVFSKLSDTLKKRTSFIYPLAISVGLMTILTGFSTSLVMWGITAGILKFLAQLMFPFTTTIFLDVVKDVQKAMPGREVILNLGRMTAIILSSILYALTGLKQLPFLVTGVAYLFYPYLIHRQRIYRKV